MYTDQFRLLSSRPRRRLIKTGRAASAGAQLRTSARIASRSRPIASTAPRRDVRHARQRNRRRAIQSSIAGRPAPGGASRGPPPPVAKAEVSARERGGRAADGDGKAGGVGMSIYL